MALVEGNQEVQTFATKAAAQSLAYGVRLWGSRRRSQNPYPQIGKALVHRLREDAVPIMDDEAVGMAVRREASVTQPESGRQVLHRLAFPIAYRQGPKVHLSWALRT